MERPFISLTSDFGVQTQGVGTMKGVALDISPDASVVHLMHGLPDFDLISAARTMETVKYLPVGYHVCVVDPGVGTKRKAIIIKVKRGDYLIGPDNGVLIPATKILGGCEKVVEITNPKYMRQPVSPVFHGRDVFTPAASYLSVGVPMEEFGKELKFEELVKAPYEEAELRGGVIRARVIHINKFGSIHLNILHSLWDEFGVEKGQMVTIGFKDGRILKLPFFETFGDVKKNYPLIFKDDYGRIEVAINQSNFSKKYRVKLGDDCIIKK